MVVSRSPIPLHSHRQGLPVNYEGAHDERKEVSMARLISLAAVAASVLTAAFLAGLTCGG
jgi:hypothetical protein